MSFLTSLLVALVMAILDKVWIKFRALQEINKAYDEAVAEADAARMQLAEEAQKALDATKDMTGRTNAEKALLRKERKDALRRLVQRL